MSLTRKKLKALGLNDDQIDSTIEDHAETVQALRDEIEKYRADAEALPAVQKQLNEFKGSDWKKKYTDEHNAFDVFKREVVNKEIRAAKERAFREILKAANISENCRDGIVKIYDIDGIEMDENGKIKDSKGLTETVRKSFPDFVVTKTERGADTAHPPMRSDGMTKEQIMSIKDPAERHRAMAANRAIFERGATATE